MHREVESAAGLPDDYWSDERLVDLGGGLRWVPFHTWGDGTDQIDARIVDANDVAVQGLDIWPADVVRGECSPEAVADCVTAELVWADGGVLCVPKGPDSTPENPWPGGFGAASLIVPGDVLAVETVREALSRFRP